MRNQKQFGEDSYLLNLTNQGCVFVLMAFAFQNEVMMDYLGIFFALGVTLFMIIPRYFINRFLDKGEREKETLPTNKEIGVSIKLNIIKLISLWVLISYTFFNEVMMDSYGLPLLWAVTIFMIIPRKLLRLTILGR